MKKRKKILCIVLSMLVVLTNIDMNYKIVKADNFYTYGVDAVKLVRELWGLGSQVVGDVWDGGITIANDLIDLVFKGLDYGSGSVINDEYGVSYDSSDNKFYFRQDENNNIVINQNFYDAGCECVEDYIVDLEGYWLYKPNIDHKPTLEEAVLLTWPSISSSNLNNILNNSSIVEWYNSVDNVFGCLNGSYTHYAIRTIPLDCYYYYYNENLYSISYSDTSVIESFLNGDYDVGTIVTSRKGFYGFKLNNQQLSYIGCQPFDFGSYNSFRYVSPFKVFYTPQDLLNYINQGKIYYPVINNINYTVINPILIENNKLSDFFYNLYQNTNVNNMSENDIQNYFNTEFNTYVNQFSSGEDDEPTPTPEPTPGGSGGGGDIGDGTTPTPDPDFGDGEGDETEKIDYLKLIYEWLEKFTSEPDSFSQKIIDYIEANDGKLEEILIAIEQISNGDVAGAGYDYTELSDFLTELWNESDQKFDTMIDLLEKNNTYQQKIINGLNDIKAILIVDTVLDVFQNRSSETANKAKEKFPTSLPWDIAAVVNVMCAEPVAPVISLPIDIPALGIEHEIVVDLSGEQWEKLALNCRRLLSILFVLFLIHLTRQMFFNGKDD